MANLCQTKMYFIVLVLTGGKGLICVDLTLQGPASRS